MRKHIVRVLCAVLLCAGCAAAADFELRLGHGAAPDNPRHLVAREFAEAVRERTGGRVDIEIHHSESLGSDSQMAEALMLGKLDISINSQGPIAAHAGELGVIGLPFLFSSPGQVYRVLDGEIGQELADPLERRNMKILAYWDNGFRHMTNNRRPVAAAADLQALRIRVPEDATTAAFFRALGAEPVTLAFGKVYEALQQDLVDGQENPLTNIYYSKLHEVQKYLSLTNHKYECCPLVISMRTWRILPEDIRAVLLEAAREFAVKHREMNNRLNGELLESLKKAGMLVNEADTAAMRAACAGVYAAFNNIYGREMVDRITASLK